MPSNRSWSPWDRSTGGRNKHHSDETRSSSRAHFSTETRENVLASIARIARGPASSGASGESAAGVKISGALRRCGRNGRRTLERLRASSPDFWRGQSLERKPMMGGGNFSRRHDAEKVRSSLLARRQSRQRSASPKTGEPAPGLHSPFFHPDAETALPSASRR